MNHIPNVSIALDIFETARLYTTLNDLNNLCIDIKLCIFTIVQSLQPFCLSYIVI